MSLSATQRRLIEGLIKSAPDSAMRALDLALAGEAGGAGPMGEIAGLVSAEALERRARGLVFAPLAPMCAGNAGGARKSFPPQTLAELWAALRSAAADQVSKALEAARRDADEAEIAQISDNLCSAASMGLRTPAGTHFETVANLLDRSEDGGAAYFAGYLDLAPLTRQAGAKLGDWLARMTEERAAAVRLAYRDATAVAPDAGPRFLEMLASQLEEPWQILRLISAIEDRPADGFLDASELAVLGRRFLEDIDGCVERLNLDTANGAPAGYAAADSVSRAIAQIAEFEQNLDLKKDGPWGSRIIKHKALLSRKVEALLKRAEDTVAAALPLKPSRAGRSARGAPNLSQPPDPAAIARAQAMVAFVERSRSAAQAGGFASLRAKVVERIDARLDHYVDDLLENLRSDAPEEPVRAAEFLDIAAGIVGLFRDEKAAQIVRRRAAA